MRVVVVRAGHVGQTAVKSLLEQHDCTVVDIAGARARVRPPAGRVAGLEPGFLRAERIGWARGRSDDEAVAGIARGG